MAVAVKYTGEWMLPCALTMICEFKGNISWIFLSVLNCGESPEKKNSLSTCGWRSTSFKSEAVPRIEITVRAKGLNKIWRLNSSLNIR